MSTYIIGDIQGCYNELQQLLTRIHFRPEQDILWSVGDLVNRGPNSLEVLRFFKQLGNRAIVVLGNHDFHLLMVAHGHTEYLHSKDTIAPILAAPDREELINWLRCRPLLHYDTLSGVAMVHAGFPPQWTLTQAQEYAADVESILQDNNYQGFLNHLYGDKPKKWNLDLKGWEKLRYIINCFTRLRYCNSKGKLALDVKGAPKTTKENEYQPWFLFPNRASRNVPIVFGHWSTLGYYVGHNVYGLDSGCLWGGHLTALRLEDRQAFHVSCVGECKPHWFLET